MVAYSFQAHFRAPILAGTKCQTIRADRKRHVRPGEELQLYTGMRTRQCKIIGRAVCANVEPVRMRVEAAPGLRCFVETPSTGQFWLSSALDKFARADGFGGWSALQEFWQAQHPDIVVFSGVIIRWSELLAPDRPTPPASESVEAGGG